MDLRACLISSVMAAIVVVCVSLMIENCGAQVGGILGTIPHIGVIAVCGLYTQLSIPEFRLAMLGFPVGTLGNGVYLGIILLGSLKLQLKLPVIYRLMVLILSALVSFTGFLALSQLLFDICSEQSEIGAWAMSFGSMILQFILGLYFCWLHPPVPVVEQSVRMVDILIRATVTFGIFMFSIWLATVAPMMGGAIINAPILTTIVFIVVFLSQGEKVAVGACGPLTLGMLSCSAFGLLVAWSIPEFGLVVGLISSWFGAIILITLPELMLSGRMKKGAEESVSENPSIYNIPKEGNLPAGCESVKALIDEVI